MLFITCVEFYFNFAKFGTCSQHINFTKCDNCFCKSKVEFLFIMSHTHVSSFLQYLKKFDLSPVFTEEEFRHWFLTQNGIINSFVVENNGKVTDLVSYYTLPSSVMHHQTHKTLRAAYSFYNVSTVTPWIELMTDALISARAVNFTFIFLAICLMRRNMLQFQAH